MNNAIPPATESADRKLRAILVDTLALEEERVSGFEDDTELFGAIPELDSQAVMGLLTEIEDHFGFIIDDEDVDGEMLETYGALLRFVMHRRPG
ncbi:acyl carrier protein [Croceicoccus marinus]|jgi:acyl carrier protein|uniref:Acyl carrier protein n=1 Tax=Croceicoccus marinus TaxID=450378 RepID=A0A7G6VRP8_9SPHN|nr:acyl carrier protein [Croceicoccus marinus]QNE04413.1 acyl carrier protein [Croceicoccus marinus]